MKSFLEHVATDLYRRFGADMSRVAIVFPNKRASLFIGEHLVAAAGKPIWSPAMTTISELFSSHSSRHLADNLTLVCLLYRCYIEVTGSDEDIDHFFSWGEVMLSDFDDVDKCMADARKVFSSVSSLHALDDTSYLTDEQRAAIESFFGCFNDRSALRERFLHLWERLYDIYVLFGERLAAEGLTYEGALYREAVGSAALWSDYDTFVFVGFNVLSPVERALFTSLQGAGRALFYWDYDTYYTSSPTEAGRHITRHLAVFPNALDSSDGEIYSNFVTKKAINCIAATTENIQARYVADWLLEEVGGLGRARIAAGRRTAVVLCDESLLLPVIHSIPDEVSQVNITGGYPLAQTPIATAVHQSFDRLARSGERDALTILRTLRDEVEAAALSAPSADSLATESLFRMYTLLTRLADLMTPRDGGSALLEVKPVTAHRLLTQAVRSVSVPFHGEPAMGLQVMGMLETRNLDFDHLLILSANEGNMPCGGSDTSFIPYNVRVGYDLTTMDHKTDIYAYYFYRLLQRSADVTIVYSTSTAGVGAQELSRYVQQLIVECPHAIARKALLSAASPMPSLTRQGVLKGEDVVAALRRITKLSPTAINTYLTCGKRFYYKYVLDVCELEEEEDVVDNRIFGNIFHAAAQELYSAYIGQAIPRSYLQALLNDLSIIERAIDKAIERERVSTAHGLTVITKAVVADYLRHLVSNDLEEASLSIEALESQFYRPWTIRIDGKPHSIEVGGFVDRLDMVHDGSGVRLRVIDYKTGLGELGKIATIDDIFDSGVKHSDYYLQAFLYSVIIREQRPDVAVVPALLFIQRARTNPDPTLVIGGAPVTDVQPFSSGFIERLSRVIDEIFDSTEPFTATTNGAVCASCPYSTLCLARERNNAHTTEVTL